MVLESFNQVTDTAFNLFEKLIFGNQIKEEDEIIQEIDNRVFNMETILFESYKKYDSMLVTNYDLEQIPQINLDLTQNRDSSEPFQITQVLMNSYHKAENECKKIVANWKEYLENVSRENGFTPLFDEKTRQEINGLMELQKQEKNMIDSMEKKIHDLEEKLKQHEHLTEETAPKEVKEEDANDLDFESGPQLQLKLKSDENFPSNFSLGSNDEADQDNQQPSIDQSTTKKDIEDHDEEKDLEFNNITNFEQKNISEFPSSLSFSSDSVDKEEKVTENVKEQDTPVASRKFNPIEQ